MLENICLNCFKDRQGYDVCPHCGYVKGTPPEQEFHLFPGTVLNGRYIIGTVLGFGGFGITYKAWDVKLNSVVAIKEFYPSGLVNRVPGESEVQVFDGTDQANYKEYLERFLDEAKNLAQFNGKDNIVNVFGFFEENNTAYIVMEFLDGISLKDYVEQNGRMPVDTALVIINDLLNGVGEVHKKGILHRDIAPDNVILTNEGEVKILDFGSARFSSDNNEKTLSAFIKPGYAAPEQYAAQGEQGIWTDIYGLGATMYFMITGIKPEESTDRLVNDTLEKPSALGVDLPIEVDKAIMKAMALEIEFRFKNTDEFLAAISGEYEIEYPEVEIKKRKRIRNIAAGISLTGFVAAIALTVFLYNYFKVDIYTTIEPCELEMWVYVENKEYDPGKSYMPDTFKEKVIAEKEGEYEEKKTAYELLGDNFSQYMADNYEGREISVKTLVFDSKEGYEQALATAAENNELPDVFFAGDNFDEIADKCMDLSEISSVLSTNSCKYINSDNYAEIYPSKKLIPLGFSAPVIYANKGIINDFNVYAEGEEAKAEFNSLEELKELDAGANKMYKTSISKGKDVSSKIWGVDRSAYNEIIALYGDGLTERGGQENVSAEDEKVINTLKESYAANSFNNTIEVSDYFYFNQLAYLIGDTSMFEYVNNYLGGGFDVLPVSDEGKCVVTLDTEVALNGNLNENEALAARALLEYMLSEDGQTIINVIAGASLPINEEVFKTYTGKDGSNGINSKFEIIADDYNDCKVVIGENRADYEKTGNKIYDEYYMGKETAVS